MTQREIVTANAAVVTPGDADPADITTAPGPRRTAICAQALVIRLGVERDDAHTAQVGQFSRGFPIRGVGKVCASNTHQTPPENDFAVMESTPAPKIDAGPFDAPRVTAWRIVLMGVPSCKARLSTTAASRALDSASCPLLPPSMKTS